eukprot:SAG22_NODE_7923_length_697_cov_1.518395_1_plen_164_part_10
MPLLEKLTDDGGVVLIGVAAALLVSRRVTAGVAARQRVEAARRAHEARTAKLAASVSGDASAGSAEELLTAADPSLLDRAMLLGVASFWAAAAVVAIVGLAIGAGWIDSFAAGWDQAGALLFGSGAGEENGGSGDGSGSGRMPARLLRASKWAALATGLKVLRV